MTPLQLKRITRVLATYAGASVVITVGLALAYDYAVKRHPYPDEPAMEAALVLGAFGGLSLLFIAATIAVLICRYQDYRNTSLKISLMDDQYRG